MIEYDDILNKRKTKNIQDGDNNDLARISIQAAAIDWIHSSMLDAITKNDKNFSKYMEKTNDHNDKKKKIFIRFLEDKKAINILNHRNHV